MACHLLTSLVITLHLHLLLLNLYSQTSNEVNVVSKMVHAPSVEAISILGDTQATAEQKLDIIKHVKNIIVGQDQRKELAVKHGVIAPLADLLSTTPKTTGKRSGQSLSPPQQWSTDEELRLQATLVIGSLASGGRTFLHPLCAANLPAILVQALLVDTSSRLITASLRALEAFVFCWSAGDGAPAEYDLWSAVFCSDVTGVFNDLLNQPFTSATARQQLRLVADIISTIPDGETRAKSMMTHAGVLDNLASLLVSHAVENKLVWYTENTRTLPPAPPSASLPNILSAISTTIAGSNYRTQRFILSPAVRDLFAPTALDPVDNRASFGARQGFVTSAKSLLPLLHIPTYRTISHNPSSNSFPALKTLQSGKYSNGPSSGPALSAGDIDHANAVIGWLIVLARSMQGFNRLTALRLLAVVANAVEADSLVPAQRPDANQKIRERQRQLALLAVPLATKLVQVANEAKVSEDDDLKSAYLIKEQSCAVLATLIKNSKELQIGSVDAGAIKHVCSILKKSFDNVALAKPMWSAKTSASPATDAPPTCQMGSSTLPLEISHALRCRQGALQAIEAIAANEDIHRKAIIEAGVVSCIIDSLRPFSANTILEASMKRTPISPKDGNTVPVVLAACRAAQSMSRSVSILRTSLIDGGIAKPLVQLLSHPYIEVQIAATDVCCNLLAEFSPMREEIIECNVVKTLTEHARSSSPALRLSSLWALKHLVFGCPREVKVSAFEELGAGWLVGIIQGEQREVPNTAGGGVSVGLSTPNAAGEQVDLLNPSSMDVDELGPGSDDVMDEDDEDGEVLFDEASNTRYQSSQLRSTLRTYPATVNIKQYLSSMRAMEDDDEYTTRRDEAAIQIQALDFIRNLVNGEDCAVLADHIMNQIGSSKVYELLIAKLAPLPRHLTGGKTLYNPTDLVLSTIHVIVHLANAGPKHRQMLIAQKALMQAMIPHFDHHDSRVRVMSVWAVNSLTWIEESGDRRDARQRSNELKALGVEQAVRGLQNDSNLDVRERVKTAIQQFETV